MFEKSSCRSGFEDAGTQLYLQDSVSDSIVLLCSPYPSFSLRKSPPKWQLLSPLGTLATFASSSVFPQDRVSLVQLGPQAHSWSGHYGHERMQWTNWSNPTLKASSGFARERKIHPLKPHALSLDKGWLSRGKERHKFLRRRIMLGK
jgi:hypothetical protein